MAEGSSNADTTLHLLDPTLHSINSYRDEHTIVCLIQLLMGCACDLDTVAHQAFAGLMNYKLEVQQQLLSLFFTN